MIGFFSSSEVLKTVPSGTLPRCGTCGLFRKCLSPKMPPYGKGKKKILVVGEAPGEQEDKKGRPFIGSSGQLLRHHLDELGIDLDRDAITTNAIICRPEKNRTPTADEIEYCRPNLLNLLQQYRPRVVITLGASALHSVIGQYWKDIGHLERWVGWKIPLKGFWVCPTYHPSFLLRNQDPVLEKLFHRHLKEAVSIEENPQPLEVADQVRVLYDEDEVIQTLRAMDEKGGWVAVDYETNCLKPEWPEAKVVSFSVSNGETTIAFPWTPKISEEVGRFLRSKNTQKIASNLRMEERWTRKIFGHGVSRWGWDTMLAAHCLDNRPGVCGLKFQAFVRLGVPPYNEKVEPFFDVPSGRRVNRISEIAMDTLLQYGGMDAVLEWHLARLQMQEMDEFRMRGFRLLMQGLLALSRAEENGIGVDEERVNWTEERMVKKCSEMKAKLLSFPEWDKWRKRFGKSASLTSRVQFGQVLTRDLGISIDRSTGTGRVATDEEALSEIDNEFVQLWSKWMHYEKVLRTFIRGIKKEMINGRVHPFFSLHTARTFRSSSDSPNFQNFPVREKEAGKIVRRLFVPREGCWLVENDFKAIEVCISACYHKDPNFISYITTPGKDMHRDMAAELFLCEPNQVTKEMRYASKNKFVFPQFYGDYYLSCTRALWRYAEGIQGPDGRPMIEWLKEKGIKERGDCEHGKPPRPGTFEWHVRQVEFRFWKEWFPVYDQWKQDWYEAYKKTLKFCLLTGFVISGYYQRNSVVNYPIQGTAFHCLLWTLIQVQKEIIRRKMRAKIVGQIHDSLIAEVPKEELLEYFALVKEIATERIREAFDWLIVPLQIEYEVAPTNWYEKRPIEFKDGQIWFEGRPATVEEIENGALQKVSA